MILLIDNFDSFTFNLVDSFEQLGEQVIVVRNDLSVKELKMLKFDRVVISPGPCTPLLSGNLMTLLAQVYNKVPVLGICLGHQAIVEFFGGEITSSKYPSHGKERVVKHFDDLLFEGIPSVFKVIRYNSLTVGTLPTDIRCLAIEDTKEIMSLAHDNYSIVGIQYHPESVLTEHGLKMLSNWLKFY